MKKISSTKFYENHIKPKIKYGISLRYSQKQKLKNLKPYKIMLKNRHKLLKNHPSSIITHSQIRCLSKVNSKIKKIRNTQIK